MQFRNFFITIIGISVLLGPTNAFAHGKAKTGLHDYSFTELWNPVLFVGVIAFFLLYLYYIKKTRSDDTSLPSVSVLKKVSFLSGLLMLYVAMGTPLHVLGDDFLFSAHMLNQSLVYLVMPPLLLLGIDKWMIKSLINIETGLMSKVLILGKVPLISLLLFNMVFSFYHVPFIFDALVSNSIYHNLIHLILTVLAFFMWLPIIPVIDELEKLSSLQKIGYIFGAGILLTPACALIIFADEPLYTVYQNAPQLFAYLNPLEDQRTGGIIMKVIQELVYSSLIGYIFFKWAKQEQTMDLYIPAGQSRVAGDSND